jgi:phosphate binding protein
MFLVIMTLVASLVLAACGATATSVPPTTAPTTAAVATTAPAAQATTAAPVATTARPTTAATTAPATGGRPVPVTDAQKKEWEALKGDVVIDGSSTVFPVTSAAAEEFRKYAKNVRISVGVSGTGGGFKKFCNAETDMQNASRPISTSEVEACKAKNVEYIELPVAYDALTVVINPQNTWVDFLTVAELKKIWEPGAQGKVTSWKQVRDSFPDRPLKLYGAGTDSGTFDYFTEAIVGTAKSSRGDYQASEDDNTLVQGVAGDVNALGYFGYAYYVENPGKLKAVPIKNKDADPAVLPSVETVKNATYQPLARPIFIYVKKEVADRAEAKAFINFYLSPSFTPLIPSREIGYVPLDQKFYDAISKRFTNKTLGTLFPKGAEVGATLDRYLQ